MVSGPIDPADVPDGNQDLTVTSPLGKTSGEPNDSFDEPVVAVAESDGVIRLQGTVAAVGDMDVFLIGALSAGDRVVVEVSTQNSPLDASIAIYDGLTHIVVNNDDRVDSLDSFIDYTARHDNHGYYLVVTHSAFAPTGRFAGAYWVDLEITEGSVVPPPVQQTLLLNFAGGRVNSPVLGTANLSPLDARDISLLYDGQTDELKDSITTTMEQNYSRFNVRIVTSDDPPPTTAFTTIHFGGFSPDTFGIADDVDLFNADRCDDALIFAESFGPEVFSHPPSVTELGVAIGNIAAHEAGHLLGLNHVDDDMDLMDDVSPADAFLFDQEFRVSPVSSDIMAIGWQDSPTLLFEAVGPNTAP